MRRAAVLIAAAAVVAVVSSCGRKGELLPPLALSPKVPSDVSVLQRGDRILLSWTDPDTYTDGTALPLVGSVEAWAYTEPLPAPAAVGTAATVGAAGAAAPAPAPKPPVDAGSMEDKGTLLFALKTEPPVVPSGPAGPPETSKAPAKKASRKSARTEAERRRGSEIPVDRSSLGRVAMYVSLRVRDPKGRSSDFTEPIRLEPAALPLAPTAVAARLLPGQVELRWEAPAANFDGTRPARVAGYNVYRAEGTSPAVLVTSAPVKDPEWRDAAAELGKTYRYVVRAAASAAAPFGESDDSEPRRVEVRDVFPPPAPTGLAAVAGAGVVSLSWDIGAEKDAAYRVWRKEEGGGDFVALTEKAILENAYTDAAVEKGRVYVYAVSAVDPSGNESPKSAPARVATGREAP